MANILNITIEKGADFACTITIRDENGATIDLTGYTFRGQARPSYDVSTASFTFDFALKNQTTSEGQVDWTLPNDALDALTVYYNMEFVYDVEMISSGDIITRILQGIATVTPEATR